jgi:phosphoribosylformylglycinamidine synthase
MVRALVVRTAGTNCEAEMVRGFALAGAHVELVHVDRLLEDAGAIRATDLIGFPGGFSHGDDIASGRIMAMALRERLWEPLRLAAERGVLMVGACNGFQVLVQVGLLPGPGVGEAWPAQRPEQELALAHNIGGSFVDCWTGVNVPADSVCIWTAPWRTGWTDEELVLPSAHGEGRLVARSDEFLDRLEARGQVALRYRENFNGSARGIAGVCDTSGRIFGLMPHPERYLDWTRHPSWTRLGPRDGRETPGLAMFRAAVAEASATVA